MYYGIRFSAMGLPVKNKSLRWGRVKHRQKMASSDAQLGTKATGLKAGDSEERDGLSALVDPPESPGKPSPGYALHGKLSFILSRVPSYLCVGILLFICFVCESLYSKSDTLNGHLCTVFIFSFYHVQTFSTSQSGHGIFSYACKSYRKRMFQSCTAWHHFCEILNDFLSYLSVIVLTIYSCCA